MQLPGQRQGPSPITLGLFAGILLVLLLSTRSCASNAPNTLQSRFAEADATTVALQQTQGVIPIPDAVRDLGQNALSRLRGGEAVEALTPVASNTGLQVAITSLQQIPGGLQVKGVITNVSATDLRVPLAAFRFIDQTGTVYAAQGDAAAMLPPQGTTTLDLTLPILDPTTLTMIVDIPEANINLEMQLLVGQE